MMNYTDTPTQTLPMKSLADGDYGLVVTLWFLGIAALCLLSYVIATLALNGQQWPALFSSIFKFFYSFYIYFAIWRAANVYKGPKLWAVAAKLFVISCFLFIIYLFASL